MAKGGYVPFTKPVTARRRWPVWGLVLASLSLVGEPATAAQLRAANVVLEGYVGHAPDGVRTEARIVLQAGGKNYDFDVMSTRSKTGSRSRRQLLQDIRPRQNTLILLGQESALGALANASPGERLRISGTHRTGSDQLKVSQIGPAPPAPTPAAAKR
jgi:hypothetical protein